MPLRRHLSSQPPPLARVPLGPRGRSVRGKMPPVHRGKTLRGRFLSRGRGRGGDKKGSPTDGRGTFANDSFPTRRLAMLAASMTNSLLTEDGAGRFSIREEENMDRSRLTGMICNQLLMERMDGMLTHLTDTASQMIQFLYQQEEMELMRLQQCHRNRLKKLRSKVLILDVMQLLARAVDEEFQGRRIILFVENRVWNDMCHLSMLGAHGLYSTSRPFVAHQRTTNDNETTIGRCPFYHRKDCPLMSKPWMTREMRWHHESRGATRFIATLVWKHVTHDAILAKQEELTRGVNLLLFEHSR